jgi:hypothetical protein
MISKCTIIKLLQRIIVEYDYEKVIITYNVNVIFPEANINDFLMYSH